MEAESDSAPMVSSLIGLQIATQDPVAVAEAWVTLFDAQPDAHDLVEHLGAERFSYRVGAGRVEFLRPLGFGPLASALGSRKSQLVGAIVTANDLDAMASRLRTSGYDHTQAGDELFLDERALGRNGTLLSVVPPTELSQVGPLGQFYEATNLVQSVTAASKTYAEVLGLDSRVFVDIPDPVHGYEGVLTMFREGQLDRLEVITPYDLTKTMGRYWERQGPSIYMAFAECADIELVEERALSLSLPFSRDVGHRERHAAFVHPRALGGTLLGLSRPNFAWDWSGRPDWVPSALRDDAQDAGTTRESGARSEHG